jgi:hypothetical protein
MDLFYIIVLSILIIFLIIVLSYYGIVLQKKVKESKEYPPQPPSACPDYWSLNVNGKCMIPKTDSKNTGSIYGTNNQVTLNTNTTYGYVDGNIDFNDNRWSIGGANAMCNKRKWANMNGIVWDGVTNFNGCN